ncbi:MAG: peptide chain release factor N(5)-glutamine methyltransferase [Pirellulaceae bacterium]|nr:peptide chain release factor N(5)-glutamine methyltransferase [Pirellulaceae bacterium]
MSETKDEAWTVLRLLEWTTDFFKKRGCPSARLDAEILLAHARQCKRIELYTAFAEIPSDEERVAFRELVRRRGEGMPVAQLVGYREFYSLEFRVDDHVLIPRPETEHLVVEALDCAKAIGTDKAISIADVGTGSGAIAITLAIELPKSKVTAIDTSPDALKIAVWNAEKHKVDDRITFIQSDLLSAVDKPEKFDLICSNPPYISEAEFEDLAPTVRDFEPRGALVAGPDGTEVIKRLIGESYNRLNSGGRLIIELSPMIADACEELIGQVSELEDLRFIKDLAGHKRILSVARK